MNKDGEDMKDEAASPTVGPAHGLLPVDIPYAFARKYGVVIVSGQEDESDARLKVALREGGDPRVLVEVRRHLARSFDVTIVDARAFDKHLSDHYAMDGSAAAMAGSLAMGGDDLDFIAGDMPTAEDLLASGDDAPAIRLINGIIAEAARQGVSRHPYRAL